MPYELLHNPSSKIEKKTIYTDGHRKSQLVTGTPGCMAGQKKRRCLPGNAIL
jgi:hypothetical protein